MFLNAYGYARHRKPCFDNFKSIKTENNFYAAAISAFRCGEFQNFYCDRNLVLQWATLSCVWITHHRFNKSLRQLRRDLHCSSSMSQVLSTVHPYCWNLIISFVTFKTSLCDPRQQAVELYVLSVLLWKLINPSPYRPGNELIMREYLSSIIAWDVGHGSSILVPAVIDHYSCAGKQ